MTTDAGAGRLPAAYLSTGSSSFTEFVGAHAPHLLPSRRALPPGSKWELYDIAKDRTESTDLSAKQPEKTKELVGKWEAWAARAKVLPWIWEPEYKPSK